MENSEGKFTLQSRDLKIETPTKHWKRILGLGAFASL